MFNIIGFANTRFIFHIIIHLLGPQILQLEDVAVNTCAHNPIAIKLKGGAYAIFHIGAGSGPPNGGANCTHHGGGEDIPYNG